MPPQGQFTSVSHPELLSDTYILEFSAGRGSILSAVQAICDKCFCRTALKAGSQLDSKLSEKGVLQLLFDLRFLRDLLSSGKPAATSNGSEQAQEKVASDIKDQQEAFEAIESDLQARTHSRTAEQRNLSNGQMSAGTASR